MPKPDADIHDEDCAGRCTLGCRLRHRTTEGGGEGERSRVWLEPRVSGAGDVADSGGSGARATRPPWSPTVDAEMFRRRD